MKPQNVRRAGELVRILDEIAGWQDTPSQQDRQSMKFDTMRADFDAMNSQEKDDDGQTFQGFDGFLTLPLDLYDHMLADLRKRVEGELRALGVEIDNGTL